MHLSLKAVWRKWRHLILLGSFVLAFLIFFQFWFAYQADQPIAIDYSRYLDYLAIHSPQAKQYASEYFRERSRDTVAAKHFEHVCATMTGLAVEDGFKPSDYPGFPGDWWCFQRAAYLGEFLQPQ